MSDITEQDGNRETEVDEGTVVVDRSGEPVEVDEGTVVVDRSGEPVEVDEGTVVVDRSAEPDESTIVVDREPANDSTVVVDRIDPQGPTIVVDKPAAKRSSVLRTLQRRGSQRQITLAPGENANKVGTIAAGPGAVAEYTAREIPAPPVAHAVIELGAEASRAEAPSMPSVAKQSRRRGLISLAAASASILVSVVGLIAVIRALLGV